MAAFDRWRAARGFAEYDEIDFESSRILPAVYSNLAGLGINHPWLSRMRGLHRYHLLRNANRQRELAGVIKQLNERGIKPVVLKGQALLLDGYFDNLGARTMLDSDLMVAPQSKQAAESILAAGRWRFDHR